MFYFNTFPKIEVKETIATNILKRFDFIIQLLKDDSFFDFIECIEGETIESISLRIYGDEDYSWLILLSNRNMNPFYVNFKTDYELMKIVKQKYGVHIFDPILYLDNDKPLDDVDTYYYKNNQYSLKYKNVIPFNIYNLEQRKNEQNRTLRVIKPEYLTQIKTEYFKIFNTEE